MEERIKSRKWKQYRDKPTKVAKKVKNKFKQESIFNEDH